MSPRLPGLSPGLALGLLLGLLPGCRAPRASAQGGHDLLQVDTVSVTQQDGGCSFNEGRPWVVNLHRALDPRLVTDLERELGRADLADQVVLGRFGEEPPARLELVLGQDLPGTLAADLVHAVRRRSSLPLVVSANHEQSTTCNRSQAYVGSLLPTDNMATPAATLDAMEAAGADPAAFWSLVPPSGR